MQYIIQYRNEYGLYILGYPNHEAKNSMYADLLEAFGGIGVNFPSESKNIEDWVAKCSVH